jgi:hypothetical protein
MQNKTKWIITGGAAAFILAPVAAFGLPALSDQPIGGSGFVAHAADPTPRVPADPTAKPSPGDAGKPSAKPSQTTNSPNTANSTVTPPTPNTTVTPQTANTANTAPSPKSAVSPASPKSAN